MRRALLVILLVPALFAGAWGAQPVQAQVTAGLEAVGQTVKLPSTDPRVIAANIINVALGLLGIIFLGLLIYAGFLYMTSGGDAEKVGTAKKMITSAVIGLILILSSWAIARFVIDRLLQATTGGGGVTATGPGGGGFGGGGVSNAFTVKSITPQGSVPIRNVQVKLLFSRPVDDASASVIVVTKNGGGNVTGALLVNGSTVTFTPADACPPPNQDLKCFDADTGYTVTVGGSLRSTTGQTVVCGGFSPSCVATFTTGNLIDTQPPTVSMVSPLDGQGVPADTLVTLQAQADDESGVAYVEFADNGASVDTSGPNASSTQTSFLADVQWNTAGIPLQSSRALTATAYDIDAHTTQSSAVNVIVRSPACFNGVQDGEETGLDCGGLSNSPGYCGACSGGSCTSNGQCASGVCLNGTCVDQPTITTVSPLEGKPGTFVTLKGSNFGTGGTVTFLGGSGTADDKVAQSPQACSAAGFNTWTPTEVIVAVPDGAAIGPLAIQNSQSGLTDATDDARGPKLPDFVVNDAAYPGLCGLQPDSGFVGDSFKAVGQGFGSAPSQMSFGSSVLTSFSSWTDSQITTNVPVAGVGAQTVTVKSGTVVSNPATYQVQNKSTAGPPVIGSVDPAQGPKGEYVTLTGTNFGYTVGTVRFKEKTSGTEAIGDTSFPEACSSGFWRETSVIVKVPQSFLNNTSLAPGDYDVTLIRSDNVASNAIAFMVNATPPKPGICSIVPSVGPVGTDVTLTGERFGSAAESVTFQSGKAAIPASWTSGEIKTSVPTGAVTGPVTVTSQGVKSNPVNYQVRNCNEQAGVCSPAEQCCPNGTCIPSAQSCGSVALSAMFAWQSSTGLIPVAPRVVEECAPDQVPPPVPSPAPWDKRAGGASVCVNATISVRFTTRIEPTTVTKSNFRVKKCTSASGEPCAATEDVTVASGFPLLQPASANQDLVMIQPTGAFDPSTTYLVEVMTGVKGEGVGGANMDETPACGQGIGYCFRFKTRASTDPCAIGAVSVSPHPYTLNDAGATVPYLASPVSADDKCVVLQCDQYEWAWEHGDGNLDGRAMFQPLVQNPKTGKPGCRQTGVAVLETGNVPVNMSAIAEPSGANVKGTAQLYVKFVPPRVEEYAPNCQLACINALIWARFNVAIDPATVAGNVVVRPCANENCVLSELGAPVQIPESSITVTTVPKSTDTTGRFLRIEPVKPGALPGTKDLLFVPGAYYRVLLKGGTDTGIRGMNGVPMTGLNDPEGFAWTFRTKLGADAFCTAESVDVAPLSKYETTVGARQLFVATPSGKPDECSAAGQMLVQTADASWQTSDPSVAAYVGNGTLDTGGPLPPRCNAMCLAMGAQGVFGKVAVCGNGIIETTDSNYCKSGKTPSGDACAVLPSGAKAGEQCDPGVAADLGLCDASTCLWKPVAQVPNGSCGNGAVDFGEACDFGSFCMGASSTSTTPDMSSCTTPAGRAACNANGGACAPVQYRGCSSFCRHTGAKSGNSTCGNGDTADGEDCDDGNLTNGDGCSSDCLHEGSLSSVASVCGNAILEPGETCEKNLISDPEFPPGCAAKTCLHTGTAQCPNNPNAQTSCCGNGAIDKGEDCDDGNKGAGDGCGPTCLLEGSSVKYHVPSFCSDGILGVGEQCEAGLPSSDPKLQTPPNSKNAAPTPPKGSPNGDGIVDNVQLAQIVGDAEPDQNGLMSSTLSATIESKKGEATYGLQCGFSDEAACPSGYGLTDKGCCNLRPALASSYPSGSGVCRNVEIRGTFNVPMNRDSVVSNVHIAKERLTGGCPTGTTEVADDFTPVRHGVGHWLAGIWKRVVAWWTGDPAIAATWCAGSVTGSWVPRNATGTTDYVFKLDSALESNTTYRVKFFGDNSTSPDPLSDNAALAKRTGIKTLKGVVAPYDTGADHGLLTFSFTTGDKICSVNMIEVRDMNKEHPLLFLKPDEEHPFTATAVSLQNGVSVPIVPVAKYSWAWAPWVTSKQDVVDIVDPQLNKTTATVRADNKNGNAFVVATLEITEDIVYVPPTKDRVVQGTAPVTVMLCENPWPNLTEAPIAPFRDKAPTGDGLDSTLFGSIFALGPYFNFSTMYCRDAGGAGTADDLPKLKINFVKPTTTDASEGILRQYLFTYGDDYPALKKDGIGIRVAANPMHLSPEDWYAWRGFGGNPKAIMVDGYRALSDGTTTYVAAANTEAPGRRIYSNVYLISHNPDAAPVTLNIYDQMVATLAFNINLTQGVGNVCLEGNAPTNYGASLYLPQGTTKPVACSSDYDCVKINEDTHCGSFKLKLARDTVRASDFAAMSRKIEQSRQNTGAYPKLTAGTFLQGFTASLWPSWDGELATALGGNPPKDPVDRFLTCGRCSKSQQACGTNADCPPDEICGGVTFENGAFVHSTTTEAATCWNTEQRKYFCPRIGASPSRVYQYRSVNAGARYELSAEFEVPPPSGQNAEWWEPPLMTEVKRCTNAATLDFLCDADADCRDCPNPKDPSCVLPVVNGACKPVGGRFIYKDVCANMAYGQSGTCGDGVIGQACLGGANDKNPCVTDAQCPGGSCAASEACELGQTRIADCTVDNQAGLKLQTCDECKGFADDVNLSACDASVKCGNGRIDRQCSGGVRSGLGCLADADCKGDQNTPDGVCSPTIEVCDDGTLNGTYGHCNIWCTGYAAFCGDSMISPGETCDNGGANGEYCGLNCNVNASCSLDCRDKAPHCGDGIVTSPEACDGQTEITTQAICTAGTAKDQSCATNADCGEGGTCATAPDPYASCQGVTKNRCATPLKQCVTAALDTCVGYDPGAHKVCASDANCAGQPNSQTACRSLTDFCVDCADGPAGDAQCSYTGIPGTCNAMPTAHIRTCNPPGNADQCAFSSWSLCKVLHFCGDGIMDAPAEECDDGAGNGNTKACTSSCKKNVCGDGKPYVGVEECDAGDQNGTVTCSADYGSTCASCSTQCRFLSTAGGYCGDIKRNGPEQCDGMAPVGSISPQYPDCVANQSDGKPEAACPYLNAPCMQTPCQKTTEPGITCQQIGYDFATNGIRPKLAALDSSLDVGVCVQQMSGCGLMHAMKRYELKAYVECLGAVYKAPPDYAAYSLAFPETLPSVNDFWKCVKEKGPALGFGIQSDPNPQLPKLVQCGASCSFSGCGKCGDEVGAGVIKGQLIDAVYNQVIPFARVSLYYKGLVVQQVASDADGKFTVTGLNNRPECAQYKIVVDKFNDNPCTGNAGDRPNCGKPQAPDWTYPQNVNEGERGGYWPYTSPVFAVSEFKTKVSPDTPTDQDAQIFVFPRPGVGEAYFTVTWTKWFDAAKGGRNNHLILPKQFAYTPRAGNDPENFTPANCDWNKRPTADHQCARDVTWPDNLVGSSDLNVLPYARLMCLHRPGEKTSQLGAANDGCPIEGAAKCLAAKGYDDPNGECTKGETFYGCTQGQSATGLCVTDADCGPGGKCTPPPCLGEYWETCKFINQGPLTTYFRYSAYSGAAEPIHMLFDSKGPPGADKSVWPMLNGSSDYVKSTLQSHNYRAAVSTDQRIVYFDAEDLVGADACDGSCKFWHLADLDPTTGDITVFNKLLKERTGPTEGVAAYEGSFSGGSLGANTQYCAEDLGLDPEGSNDTLYRLYKTCTSPSNCVQSNGQPIPNATCIPVNRLSHSRANY